MMEAWINISYMVQLVIACLLFMSVARKRKRYVIRVLVAGALLVMISYWINRMFTARELEFLTFLYWAYYIAASVIFVKIGLDVSWGETLYCTVCACAMQHVAFDIYVIYCQAGGDGSIVPVIIYIVVYGVFYHYIVKKLPSDGRFLVGRKSLFPMTTIILLVWIVSVLENSDFPGYSATVGNHVLFRLNDILCCYYVLWVQINQKEKLNLQRDLDEINYMWRQQKKQYEVTKETIDSINRKCHDLKHQISALRHMTDGTEKEKFFNEIENDIMIYDTAVQTGNRALDTVLMEKGLFCKNHNIQWSCMVNGTKLDFMRLEDIYSIFGNALDNAIYAVTNLEDHLKRVINVKIISHGNLVMIQIENYYNTSLKFHEGLPLTLQPNKQEHGYGMKSIRYTAEKYNGVVTIKTEQDIFMLHILIPAQEKAAE